MQSASFLKFRIIHWNLILTPTGVASTALHVGRISNTARKAVKVIKIKPGGRISKRANQTLEKGIVYLRTDLKTGKNNMLVKLKVKKDMLQDKLRI